MGLCWVMWTLPLSPNGLRLLDGVRHGTLQPEFVSNFSYGALLQQFDELLASVLERTSGVFKHAPSRRIRTELRLRCPRQGIEAGA
jgi:hypothetical protein